jgi:hypothetical protein
LISGVFETPKTLWSVKFNCDLLVVLFLTMKPPFNRVMFILSEIEFLLFIEGRIA